MKLGQNKHWGRRVLRFAWKSEGVLQMFSSPWFRHMPRIITSDCKSRSASYCGVGYQYLFSTGCLSHYLCWFFFSFIWFSPPVVLIFFLFFYFRLKMASSNRMNCLSKGVFRYMHNLFSIHPDQNQIHLCCWMYCLALHLFSVDFWFSFSDFPSQIFVQNILLS